MSDQRRGSRRGAGVQGNVIGGIVCAVPGGVPSGFPASRMFRADGFGPPQTGSLPVSKLDPASEKLFAELAAGADRVILGVPYLRGDQVEVCIWLKEPFAEAVRRIKELGGEVVLESARAGMIVARVPWKNLKTPASLAEVAHIAPAVR